MKYLKEFSTESEYTAYRSGDNYIRPNISICDGNEIPFYDLPPPQRQPNFNGHNYVDLGLPSGTLWATQNVGARYSSDPGLYFQWGDTQGCMNYQVIKGKIEKEFAYDYSDYKWYSGGTLTKYNTAGATLELEDDAAHVNMGGDWHMPTPEQIQELIDNTKNTWTSQYSTSGRLFTSKKDNSKSIFIPGAGYASGGSVHIDGGYGYIWSSVLDLDDVLKGLSLYVNKYNGLGLCGKDRYYGLTIRGVIG